MANRAQDLYWKALVQLRVDCEYMRLYRDALAWWSTRFGVARAIVSGTALTAWIVVKDHPMIWGGVIAAVQMTEGLEKATSLSAHVRGAHDLMNALETQFADCTMEWEDIYAGRLTEEEINLARHRLVTRSQEADHKNLPGGLRQKKRLLKMAEREAGAYFKRTYGESEDEPEGLEGRPLLQQGP